MAAPSTPASIATPPATNLKVRVVDRIAQIPAAAWDALAADDDPFTEHAFLHVLEATGCVGPDTAWQPRHVTLWRGDTLVAAMPCYLRWDSDGEYVFDYSWAEAYHRAGLSYYPKATAAVPFTPVPGRRLLLAPQADASTRAQLTAALIQAALAHFTHVEPVSSLHVLFAANDEATAAATHGALTRLGIQYHWFNRGYGTFADYVNDLRSKKRKQVLRERTQVANQNIELLRLRGDELRGEHIDALWAFYQNTGARKWGVPYLNRAWFDAVVAAMPARILAVLARRDGTWIGGTFNFAKGAAIYGRYWGQLGNWEALHFECCYYQLIEHAIAHGIARVEAGAQGEHKFLRGYEPVPTHSMHWIRHEGGRDAIAAFLAAEVPAIAQELERLRALSPVKVVRGGAANTGGGDSATATRQYDSL